MLIFSRFETNDAYKKNAYKKTCVLMTLSSRWWVEVGGGGGGGGGGGEGGGEQ